MRVMLKTRAGVELVAGELLVDNPLALQQALIRGDAVFEVVPQHAAGEGAPPAKGRKGKQPVPAGAGETAGG